MGARQAVDDAHDRFEDHVTDVDVVVDPVGGVTQARSWSVLRPGGVLVGVAAPPDAEEAARHGARAAFVVVESDRTGPEGVARLIEDGRLTPVLDRVVPLAETRDAYRALVQEHRRGKAVIHVAGCVSGFARSGTGCLGRGGL